MYVASSGSLSVREQQFVLCLEKSDYAPRNTILKIPRAARVRQERGVILRQGQNYRNCQRLPGPAIFKPNMVSPQQMTVMWRCSKRIIGHTRRLSSWTIAYTDKPIYYYQIGKRIQYILIISNGSRNSSLSFIENFQNRKQFQGIQHSA